MRSMLSLRPTFQQGVEAAGTHIANICFWEYSSGSSLDPLMSRALHATKAIDVILNSPITQTVLIIWKELTTVAMIHMPFLLIIVATEFKCLGGGKNPPVSMSFCRRVVAGQQLQKKAHTSALFNRNINQKIEAKDNNFVHTIVVSYHNLLIMSSSYSVH
jgi:hypothetical protein